MKRIIVGISALIFLSVVSCKEDKTGVNLNPDYITLDTTYMVSPVPTPQSKAVLIEDISGVKCVNCPAASLIAHQIKDANPGKVNILTIQPDYNGLKALTSKIDHNGVVSRYNMTTTAGSDIISALAIPNSLPNGYINRKLFSGKSDLLVPREEWSSSASQELAATSPVNLNVQTSYNSSTFELTAVVTVTYTAAVPSDSNYLSVAIIEDEIIDAQESTDSVGNVVYLQDYEHNHVLRDMMTASMGDRLDKKGDTVYPLVAGRVFMKRYTKKVMPFMAGSKKLGVVAFVHRGVANKCYVFQSATSLVP